MYTFWISVVFLHNNGTMDRLSVGHKSNVMLCLLVEILQRDSPSTQKILISEWHTFAYVNTRKTSLEIHYTGRFIVFSVITNIYNKKTKGPTLMELFTATGKLKKFFSTTRDVRCVHHGQHGTHQCDIQVLATHASTWVLSACTDTQFQ